MWKTTVSEIAEITGGLPSSFVLEEGGGGQPIPLASVGDLIDGRVAAVGTMRTALLADDRDLGARRMAEGDVAVAARGAGYKAALVRADAAGAVASANLIVLRPTGRLLPAVLLAALTSAPCEAQIAKLARGTGRMVSLSAKALRSVAVPVPPMPVQEALTALTEARWAEAEAAALVARERDSLYRAAMDRALFPPEGDD